MLRGGRLFRDGKERVVEGFGRNVSRRMSRRVNLRYFIECR